MLKPISSRDADLTWKEDGELVSAIQKKPENSKKEITELYSRYAEDVYRMTRSLFTNTHEDIKSAEDLFQEAWRKALDRIDRYDINVKTTFGAWVKGFADNLFHESIRATSRKEAALEEIGHLLTRGDNNEPLEESNELEDDFIENNANYKIDKDLLIAALELLSLAEREILIEWHRTFDKNNPGSNAHAENLQRLADKFCIKSESLRKIKQRAIDKIQSYLRL